MPDFPSALNILITQERNPAGFLRFGVYGLKVNAFDKKLHRIPMEFDKLYFVFARFIMASYTTGTSTGPLSEYRLWESSLLNFFRLITGRFGWAPN